MLTFGTHELIDLALGSTQLQMINFTLLRAILHTMACHLNMGRTTIELNGINERLIVNLMKTQQNTKLMTMKKCRVATGCRRTVQSCCSDIKCDFYEVIAINANQNQEDETDALASKPISMKNFQDNQQNSIEDLNENLPSIIHQVPEKVKLSIVRQVSSQISSRLGKKLPLQNQESIVNQNPTNIPPMIVYQVPKTNKKSLCDCNKLPPPIIQCVATPVKPQSNEEFLKKSDLNVDSLLTRINDLERNVDGLSSNENDSSTKISIMNESLENAIQQLNGMKEDIDKQNQSITGLNPLVVNMDKVLNYLQAFDKFDLLNKIKHNNLVPDDKTISELRESIMSDVISFTKSTDLEKKYAALQQELPLRFDDLEYKICITQKEVTEAIGKIEPIIECCKFGEIKLKNIMKQIMKFGEHYSHLIRDLKKLFVLYNDLKDQIMITTEMLEHVKTISATNDDLNEFEKLKANKTELESIDIRFSQNFDKIDNILCMKMNSDEFKSIINFIELKLYDLDDRVKCLEPLKIIREEKNLFGRKSTVSRLPSRSNSNYSPVIEETVTKRYKRYAGGSHTLVPRQNMLLKHRTTQSMTNRQFDLKISGDGIKNEHPNVPLL